MSPVRHSESTSLVTQENIFFPSWTQPGHENCAILRIMVNQFAKVCGFTHLRTVISINAHLHFTTVPSNQTSAGKIIVLGAFNILTGVGRLRHSCATRQLLSNVSHLFFINSLMELTLTERNGQNGVKAQIYLHATDYATSLVVERETMKRTLH